MRTITNKRQGRGFRMTPQRAELLRLLDGDKSHPSAEELHRRLSRRLPNVSLATVYNTLETLAGAGKVKPIATDPARRRFDPCCTPHYHLMCVHCGSITDLPAPPVAPVAASAPEGFKILSYSLDFYGVCPACDKKRK